ncbi:MAG: SgcJ/EcaC family oxidoreductase [Acidobacteriaceae bacterium]
MLVEAKINELLNKMSEGWRRGDGTLFAQPFSKDARFGAFDGSMHHGPDEIAAFHQKAFDTFLKGTSLEVTVNEMKQIDQRTWLVFTSGWHRRTNAPDAKRYAESVNIFVCKADEEKTEFVAFQNTRVRPITDKASAELWRAFDTSWETARSGNR